MPALDENSGSAVPALPATTATSATQVQAEPVAGQAESAGVTAGIEFSAYPSELEFGTDSSDVS